MKFWCMLKDEPWGQYTKWNKPVTKGQILYDSTDTRCLKQSNSQKQSRMMFA